MTTKTVRRKQVRNATFKLLTQEGLTGWRVRFNPRLTRALGRCDYTTKTIDYQPRYMEQNDWEQVLGTIKHEAAHAIAGRYAGHGAHWASTARRLGLANPSAINHTAKLTKRFTGTCPSCERTIQRDRRALRQACGKCCDEHAGGLFSPRFKFIWTSND